MKTFISYVLLATALCGCATSTKIVTGQTRPPIDAKEVRFYTAAPAGAAEIAVITATAEGKNQGAVDAALSQLRWQAGKLGANGIVIEGQSHSQTEQRSPAGFYGGGLIIAPSWTTSQTVIGARAIYVP